MKKKETKTPKEAKASVPGQQMGLYSKNQEKDVRQMVRTLNPGKHSMDSRG